MREEMLRAERDFLLDRVGHAGKCMFGGKRWTGMSSNALVDVAFGRKNDRLPLDGSDLAACYRTVMRLPDHLISRAVIAQLQEGELFVAGRHPGSITWARDDAEWPGLIKLQARARAAEEAPHG